MATGDLAGRSYGRIYSVSGRTDLHQFLQDAVKDAGGHVLYASSTARTPVFLGIQASNDERLGLLCYPFRCNPPPIKGRPADEHRIQVRYGSEKSWLEDHPLGRDIAGVDITLVLGVHLGAGIFVGLDPMLYDPLPMGISVEFKDETVVAAQRDGWVTWERVNMPGIKRAEPRAVARLETLVAFRSERLLDFARFEREAATLGLEPALRFAAAERAASTPSPPSTTHMLEDEFALTSLEILEVIERRKRLKVAVRGGVAELKLERMLGNDPAIKDVQDVMGDPPDFEVQLQDGRSVTVECKNASPRRYANGDFRVEVQKTRASKGDPASRYYNPEQFDVVAACIFAATRNWEFRFKRTALLQRDAKWTDRLAPLQRVDESWSPTLQGALSDPL